MRPGNQLGIRRAPPDEGRATLASPLPEPAEAAARLLIVTGIFPPDVGGPATHAKDLFDELTERGHVVRVVTLWDGRTLDARGRVARFPRRWSPVRRSVAVTRWIARYAGRFDAIYATGLHTEAVIGGRIAGVPVVVKVVGDPVWERGRRRGWTREGFDAFESHRPRHPALRLLAWMRDATLRHAAAITAPNVQLAALIDRWLGGPSGTAVIENGVRTDELGRRAAAVERGGFRAAFVGRLVAHKQVDRVLEAIARSPGWELDVVGDGPERARLESRAAGLGVGERVTFHGDVPHERVARVLAAADALVLASDYEGLPHVVLEALAVGTPVVAPVVGGVGDVVEDGVSGLLLPSSDAGALARALSAWNDDASLGPRLSAGAFAVGTRWTFDRTADEVLSLVEDVRHRGELVFCGKTRVPSSDDATGRSRIESITRHVDASVVGEGRSSWRWRGRTRVVTFPSLRPAMLGGAVFYPFATALATLLASGRRPAMLVCQSPYEGAAAEVWRALIPRSLRPSIVVEVHGDWRTATRLYGSRWRRLLSVPADAVAARAVRGADVVRVIGDYTERLVRAAGFEGPVERFVAFSGGLASFLGAPTVPASGRPRALFAGVLEPYKGVDVLLQAWRRVIAERPDAELVIAGDGTHARELRAAASELGRSLRFVGHVERDRLRALIDDASFLVLPSRSEGLGRIVLEAYARNRPVLGTNVGGIPELVQPGWTGDLVEPGDPGALAEAMLRLLAEPARTAEMGEDAGVWIRGQALEEDFERGIARLAERAAR
ncbi:MAG: glycosyltransferase family 4 protein [Actinomycetota bacterium]